MLNTGFPPKRAWSQINTASLTPRQIEEPHLDALFRIMIKISKLKCIWNKCTKNEKIRVAVDCVRLDMIIVTICCYLEKKIDRVLKCHVKSSSYFEICTSLF